MPGGPSVTIRVEAPADYAAIDEVVRLAFGGDGEVDLIRRLRAHGDIALALVAEQAEAVVGHIVMSRLATTMDDRPVRGLALAPVSVAPACQRSGIGGRLIRAALDGGRDLGFEAVILLGHPHYYPRFGFSPDLAQRLRSPFEGPAFMALELQPGALSGTQGAVVYPAAFQIDASH